MSNERSRFAIYVRRPRGKLKSSRACENNIMRASRKHTTPYGACKSWGVKTVNASPPKTEEQIVYQRGDKNLSRLSPRTGRVCQDAWSPNNRINNEMTRNQTSSASLPPPHQHGNAKKEERQKNKHHPQRGRQRAYTPEYRNSEEEGNRHSSYVCTTCYRGGRRLFGKH